MPGLTPNSCQGTVKDSMPGLRVSQAMRSFRIAPPRYRRSMPLRHRAVVPRGTHRTKLSGNQQCLATTLQDNSTTSTSDGANRFWNWQGHRIRYQKAGNAGPPILFVHGFGGNCDHFRKNMPAVSSQYRAHALDLLGYGYSDKPDPRQGPRNSLYCFETWGQQVVDFIDQVIGEPTVLVCNSVGGLVGLQASILSPSSVLGVQVMNISVRALHTQRMSPALRPAVNAVQTVLRTTPLGKLFFDAVAKPQAVKNILRQAYCDPETVTDELVSFILQPGLQPGAAEVFLDFISYSSGPLPEALMAATPVPVSILWGEADPWEDVVLAKKLFGGLPRVVEFVTLPGVGHCPQDEAPGQVNPLIKRFAKSVTDVGTPATLTL